MSRLEETRGDRSCHVQPHLATPRRGKPRRDVLCPSLPSRAEESHVPASPDLAHLAASRRTRPDLAVPNLTKVSPVAACLDKPPPRRIPWCHTRTCQSCLAVGSLVPPHPAGARLGLSCSGKPRLASPKRNTSRSDPPWIVMSCRAMSRPNTLCRALPNTGKPHHARPRRVQSCLAPSVRPRHTPPWQAKSRGVMPSPVEPSLASPRRARSRLARPRIVLPCLA